MHNANLKNLKEILHIRLARRGVQDDNINEE